MYIRKTQGPRQVTLSDGRILTQGDLPAASTTRWVASRKAVIVHAVESGLISQEEALQRYGISDEELTHWCTAFARFGESGLKNMAIQRCR